MGERYNVSAPGYLSDAGECGSSTAERIGSGRRVAGEYRGRIAVILQADVADGHTEITIGGVTC